MSSADRVQKLVKASRAAIRLEIAQQTADRIERAIEKYRRPSAPMSTSEDRVNLRSALELYIDEALIAYRKARGEK